MNVVDVCRCCLTQGTHKDLNTTYVWFDNKEIYSDMLMECFNIALSAAPHSSNGICESCIEDLRNSMRFKRRVLDAEQEFLKRIKEKDVKDEKPIEVKLEPKQDSNDYDESDEYLLVVSDENIKNEPKELPMKKKLETRRSTRKVGEKSGSKAPESSWRAKKIRNLVTRLATSINSCEVPDITTLNKKEMKEIVKTGRSKMTIKKEPSYGEGKINVTWVSKVKIKEKHKSNLKTILKFSNATPFNDKSLLGYICGYCEAAYPDPVDLRHHTKADHEKERLNFKSTFDMTEYNVKLDVTDLKCTICETSVENLYSLKDHLVKSHNKNFHNDIKDHILQFKLKKGDIHDCCLCTSKYETFKTLKQHMNVHYSNYQCEKCDSSFATKRSLSAHLMTHQEGSHKCDHCEKVFSNNVKKRYHEKMKHLGERNISNCPYCNESFRSYYQRNQHLVKVHNSEAQYKCNVCSKAYILRSLLMYHIKKNHLMERNFQCNECGYRFFSKKSLKAHMVKHTGERNYACQVCNKSYARKYTLREHMRIHNNDRRFKCSVCAMTFVQKCSLKSHLLSNHGISMAACDITST